MGGEGDDKSWDGWIGSLTHWTWVWVSSRSWWWTGKPGVLQSMGSQRLRRDCTTELNWRQYQPWPTLRQIHKEGKFSSLPFLSFSGQCSSRILQSVFILFFTPQCLQIVVFIFQSFHYYCRRVGSGMRLLLVYIFFSILSGLLSLWGF